jgi:AraC family transcriptional regulator
VLPGSRLRETKLADRLQVSRTPVREALKRLESEGKVHSSMASNELVLTSSGRDLLCGTIADPVRSSVSQGWHGVLLEFFSGASADFTAVFANHGIRVQLNGCMGVYQRFEGKSLDSKMRRGDLVVSPAGIPKTFQHRGGDGDFVVVHLAPALLKDIVDDWTEARFGSVELTHAFCTRDPKMERLALALCDEYRTEDVASGVCAEALASQLAVQLLRRYWKVGTAADPPADGLSRKTLARAIEYIETNLADDLTIQDVANALSMSAGRFAHAFRNSIGLAPHRYVIERRIELAKRLLLETNLPIANLATRAGFSTHAHFCVTFHRMVGLTPGQYRRAS